MDGPQKVTLLFWLTWKENKCTDVELKITGIAVVQVMMMTECKKEEQEKEGRGKLKTPVA